MKNFLRIILLALILTSCKGFYVLQDKCGNKYRSHMPPSRSLDGSK